MFFDAESAFRQAVADVNALLSPHGKTVADGLSKAELMRLFCRFERACQRAKSNGEDLERVAVGSAQYLILKAMEN